MCLSLPCAGEGRANATCPCLMSPLQSSELPGNPLFHADSRPQSIKKPSNIIHQRRAPWPGQSGQCTVEGHNCRIGHLVFVERSGVLSSDSKSCSVTKRPLSVSRSKRCISSGSVQLKAAVSRQCKNKHISYKYILFMDSKSTIQSLVKQSFDLKRCIFHVICQSYIHSNSEPKTQL